MRLNPECIRDILLDIENETTFNNAYRYDPSDTSSGTLAKYESSEILYHLRQCKESGFFLKSTFDMTGSYLVEDLSPKAHQFLSDIRSDTIWTQTKTTAKKVGSQSLIALMQISTAIVTSSIKSHLSI